jgi:hypothetical protein
VRATYIDLIVATRLAGSAGVCALAGSPFAAMAWWMTCLDRLMREGESAPGYVTTVVYVGLVVAAAGCIAGIVCAIGAWWRSERERVRKEEE